MIRTHVAAEPAIYYSSEIGRSPLSDFYDAVDAAVGDWEVLVRPLHSGFSRSMGRPTDLVLYVKMFLVAYFQNAVYDTQLCALCADSMSIRRFLGLTLVDAVPDHSSISRIRKSFGQCPALASTLEQVVSRCVKAGLVAGRSVHVDATLVRANASINSLCSLDSDRSVDEHLKEARQNGEKLAVKNSEFYSPGDPASRIRKKRSDKPMMCYTGVHVTDSANQVIVSARMDYGDAPEVAASLPAIRQAQARLEEMGESLEVVVADKGYDSVEFHQGIEEMGLTPATFYARNIQEEGRFGRSEFEFDAERNVYVCPLGKELSYRGQKGPQLAYVSKTSDCKFCPFRDMCLGKKAVRKEISRMPGEEASERNRAFVSTPEGKRHLRARSSTVEPAFGHMKRYGGLERISCQGLPQAEVKLIFAAVGWNIKKLIKSAASGAKVRLNKRNPAPDAPQTALKGSAGSIGHGLGRLERLLGRLLTAYRALRGHIALRKVAQSRGQLPAGAKR